VDERESLGKYLKRERENRRLSLKEVSKQIKVREPFLRAFEEDRRDLLPSVTYVKGFLSAYAKYLGLDPNEVILRYEAESKGEPIIRPEVLPQKRMLWNPKFLWTIGGVIIVSFIVLYIFLLPSKPPVVPLPPKPEAKKTIAQPPPPPAGGKSSALEEKGISLDVKAVERTWVAIQIDGQPVSEATFQPGESFSYRAAKRIELVLGNAGGLEMAFNERRLEKMGKSGEVVTVIFTPQGVKTTRRELPEPAQE
jgi:transcriptional regulator with XRE-family HTH domain